MHRASFAVNFFFTFPIAVLLASSAYNLLVAARPLLSQTLKVIEHSFLPTTAMGVAVRLCQCAVAGTPLARIAVLAHQACITRDLCQRFRKVYGLGPTALVL